MLLRQMKEVIENSDYESTDENDAMKETRLICDPSFPTKGRDSNKSICCQNKQSRFTLSETSSLQTFYVRVLLFPS